jgi:hypothetical protein
VPPEKANEFTSDSRQPVHSWKDIYTTDGFFGAVAAAASTGIIEADRPISEAMLAIDDMKWRRLKPAAAMRLTVKSSKSTTLA